MLVCVVQYRTGEEWKRGRSAVSKQMLPGNVKLYTPGLNDVLIRFTEHLKSIRDEDDKIPDIVMPLRRLLVECRLPRIQYTCIYYTTKTSLLFVTLYMCIPLTVSAKFVFDTDLHVFDSPTSDTEKFIEGVTLCFDCFGKMIVEPPFYKLYPNRLFRDFRKAITVSICTCMYERELDM